jgi:nucleotide-binding universal stress UspA family protein
MKVLIGVDDSKHAEATLEFVKRMPWPANTSMIVASAVHLPPGAYSESFAPIAVDMSVWLEELTTLHKDLVARATRTLTDAGLKAEGRVLQGDPREGLIDLARQERVDLIVVGSHGRTGLAKFLMGSVASHVVTHAPCTVTVVRPA